jgi:hypothetical protein
MEGSRPKPEDRIDYDQYGEYLSEGDIRLLQSLEASIVVEDILVFDSKNEELYSIWRNDLSTFQWSDESSLYISPNRKVVAIYTDNVDDADMVEYLGYKYIGVPKGCSLAIKFIPKKE